MKGLFRILFKTFIISIILGIAVNSIYYAVTQNGKGSDYAHVIPVIISGALFLNFILLVMSIPALFLQNTLYWDNKLVRFLLYFSGPIIFLVTVLFMKLQRADEIFYLSNAVIYLIVHSVFYFKLNRKNA